MSRVAEVARIWQQAGVSCIPIQDNTTKRPAISWSPFMAQAPSLDDLNDWWGNGREYGLALICGKVSGNLELTEIEGRALSRPGAILDLIMKLDELGAGDVFTRLTESGGYSEDSPSGGMHLLYRISDHEVPGNTKIAQAANRECLAETRGEGGYVIVAPTPGLCHPTGTPWRLVNGTYGQLPTITWEERNRLHSALHDILDETPARPEPAAVSTALVSRETSDGSSPGDHFERETDWEVILAPHGWHMAYGQPGGERSWTRPGKSLHDGISATTGRANDRDRLYVFSTSTEFEAEVPYTKFGAWALLNHGGDHHVAAQALVRLGYGTQRERIVDTTEWTPPTFTETPPRDDIDHESYENDDMGNGQRLVKAVKGRYRYVCEEKQYYRWQDHAWIRDVDGGMVREWTTVTEGMLRHENEKVRKWARTSRSLTKTTATINLAKSYGLSHSSTEWAPFRNLINVQNGVYNFDTGELLPHAPEYLMTHTLGAAFDPAATCPKFEEFVERALPDPEMRSYLQRALGYSLLGSADQRAIFLIYGPSGTGKSTLIETMRSVFGDYGTTAGPGAFRTSNNNSGPSADLHALRGRRFVTTSETAENASFDEDLLKRLSGRDRVTSRSLYQEPVEWVPECALWIATNNPPKFNSDDDAVWRRTKLVPFLTVFQGDGEITDYARKVLAAESSGILNWLLAGLAEYKERGLDEPESVMEAREDQRHESDSVTRFLADRIDSGHLTLGDGQEIATNVLERMYRDWASDTGDKALGHRRFVLRVGSSQYQLERQDHVFRGVGRTSESFLS